jgi:hypothetical protein
VADVMQETGHNELAIGAGLARQVCGLEGMGELVNGFEAVGAPVERGALRVLHRSAGRRALQCLNDPGQGYL